MLVLNAYQAFTTFNNQVISSFSSKNIQDRISSKIKEREIIVTFIANH